MTWRSRIGWRLRCWADRIDRKHAAVHMSTHSFTFELGEGIRFRTDGKGCPLAFFSHEYHRADDESDSMPPSVDWSAQIQEWREELQEYKAQPSPSTHPKQFLVTPHRHGRSALQRQMQEYLEKGVIHVPGSPHPDLPPFSPQYWRIMNHLRPCFYTSEWTDEVGDVWVCKIHKNNSRHEVTQGFDKPCLTLDPYPEKLCKERGNENSNICVGEGCFNQSCLRRDNEHQDRTGESGQVAPEHDPTNPS